MKKLYWNVLFFKEYTLFLALSADGLTFLDFLNNPKLIKNFVNWMLNLKIMGVLEHNPDYVKKYLQRFEQNNDK